MQDTSDDIAPRARFQQSERRRITLTVHAEIAYLFKWQAHVGVFGLFAAATAIDRPIWLIYPTFNPSHAVAMTRVVHPLGFSAEQIDALYADREKEAMVNLVRVVFVTGDRKYRQDCSFRPDHFNAVFRKY